MKAFYTHGHLYQVNRTRDLLAEKGLELGCLFAFYGHTHVAKYMSILMVFMLLILEVYLNLEVQWKKHMLKLLLMIQTLHGTINFKNRHHETISHTTFK